MIRTEDLSTVMGSTLYASDGDKIGKIGQVFLDDETGQPEFATVNTGFFGSNESYVPLAEASTTGDGVTVPYSKNQIKDAPNVNPADGHLSQDQEQELYSYYGLNYSDSRSDTGLPTTGRDTGTAAMATGGLAPETAGVGNASGPRTGTADETTAAVGRDTSGPTTDDAMTRSEERVHAGTERVQTGRARLRKWVETEDVNVTVPVSKERARLVTEPITDANRGDALDGPDLSEEEHEATLTEERPIVTKETVPVERVRVEKDVEQDEAQVNEQVRKERIGAEGDLADDGRTGDSVVDLTKTQERQDR
ncbi:MAG: DUF2382 domain-containing protein [Actinomycetes bacterium]